MNLNFGQYTTTYNISLADPWIKGDRTALEQMFF